MDEKTQYEKAAVLVVDDNEMSLKVAARLLKQHGITATTARSGRECLTLAGEQHFDLILMDHMMPEMDGVETLARLKEEQLIPDSTAVVMVSGGEAEELRDILAETAFDGCICKPIEPAELDALLRSFLLR